MAMQYFEKTDVLSQEHLPVRGTTLPEIFWRYPVAPVATRAMARLWAPCNVPLCRTRRATRGAQHPAAHTAVSPWGFHWKPKGCYACPQSQGSRLHELEEVPRSAKNALECIPVSLLS